MFSGPLGKPAAVDIVRMIWQGDSVQVWQLLHHHRAFEAFRQSWNANKTVDKQRSSEGTATQWAELTYSGGPM